MKLFLSSILILITFICFSQKVDIDTSIGNGIDTSQLELTMDSLKSAKLDRLIGLLDSSLAEKLRQDSLSLNKNDSLVLDSLAILNDSVLFAEVLAHVEVAEVPLVVEEVGPTYEIAENGMESPVDYHAKDSIRFDVESQKALLYGDAEVNFDEVSLKAEIIEIDWVHNNLVAYGREDSLGNLSGTPEFSDGSQNFRAEKIIYNYETEKGNIHNLYSKDGESHIHGETVRKTPENNMLIKNGRYTTCPNEEDPHFYISLNKMKVIPEKTVVAKGANLVLSDVHTPLWVPFGVFPINNARSSGILMPSYGNSPEFGYSLNQAGYYFGISDHLDAKIYGDVYTKGKYEINLESRFVKRYKYKGNLMVNYGITPMGDPLSLEYRVEKDFFIRGNYQLDRAARPGISLNSKIEFGTSSYQTNNKLNTDEFLQNNMKSSFAFSKKLNRKMNFTASLRHDQNKRSNDVKFQLPHLNYTISRITVKDITKSPKNNAINKIGFNYNLGFRNNIVIPDTVLYKNWMQNGIITNTIAPSTLIREPNYYSDSIPWRNFMDYGFMHRLPITTNFKKFYINFKPSLSLKQRFYFEKEEREWNDELKKVDTTFEKGFYQVGDFNTSIGASTAIYGMFKFRRGKVKAIRHTLRPNLSYSMRPDFADISKFSYYGEHQRKVANSLGLIDSLVDPVVYSKYKGVYGTAPSGKSSTLRLTLNNLVEGKRVDTTNKEGFKKFKIIENLSMAGGYNFAARGDSLNFSTINTSFRTSILKRKLNINIRAVHDPYRTDSFNRRRKELFYNTEVGSTLYNDGTEHVYDGRGRKIARLKTVKATIGTKLTSDGVKSEFIESGPIDYGQQYYFYDDLPFEVVYDLPWTVNLNYSLNLEKKFIKNIISQAQVDSMKITQNINARINVKISNKWRLGVRTGYDFSKKELSYTKLDIYRDLHCFEMRVEWVPFSTRQFFLFTFKVKSTLLQDLKYDKNIQNSQYNYESFD